MLTNKQIVSILGSGILASPLFVYAQSQKQDVRPNILFILSDDHARTSISVYGSEISKLAKTPNLDKIAEDGVLFNNMLCTNSISGPSRACLITGKYSTTHGFYQNEGGIRFDDSQETVPVLLQKAGYATSIFGKWHLYTQPKGFDHFMIHDNPDQQGSYWDPLFNTNGEKARHPGYATTLTADAAINWMDAQRDETKPFCLMLNFKAPHRPWMPDKKDLDLFKDIEFPYPDTFNDMYEGREKTLGENMASIDENLSRGDLKMTAPPEFSKEQIRKWSRYGQGKDQYWTPDSQMTEDEVKKWKYQVYLKNYLRCVKSVDDNVGRVIDYLKKNGLYENTIIIYMGDQGFFLGEHGLFDKRWMYEESIQMPCMMSYPKGIKNKGTRGINQLALNIDIAPTIYDYAGVKTAKGVQGVSLRPLLEDNSKQTKNWRKSAYYQYFEYPKWHNVQPHYGVRTDRYKLIHFYYDIDVWEFYDLDNDPKEMKNQINNPLYASIIDNLKKEIDRLQQQYDDVLTLEQRRELTRRYMITYEGEEQ